MEQTSAMDANDNQQPATHNPTITTTFLIIGGGIAGVSCLETLRALCPQQHCTLVTESALIKRVTNLVPLGKALSRFDVAEQLAAQLVGDGDANNDNVRIITGDRLSRVHSASRCAVTAAGVHIQYKLLCICTGARPQLIAQAAAAPHLVLGIRDTDSVEQFQQRIRGSRRIAIVGNGGIASECAYAVRNVHVDWVIKDRFVAQTFVDPGAAAFFRTRLERRGAVDEIADGTIKGMEPNAKVPVKRLVYGETTAAATPETDEERTCAGAALGPDWHRKWDLSATAVNDESNARLPEQSITVHTSSEVLSITKTAPPAPHPLLVQLTNDARIECDLIVSATGVWPAVNFACTDADLALSATDGGILVDHLQRTNVPHVYAAGDCCTANWHPMSPHWQQMRLWTQARQMGAMAARAMVTHVDDDGAGAEEDVLQDFCFELFGHVTQLFGYQVVLLGKFNGQGLDGKYEALIRSTPGREYIKYVLQDGRVQGAILIGETGLEETTENLILNGLDVSGYGDRLLDPDVDIEDYFD